MSDPEATDNGQMFDLASGLDTPVIGASPAQAFAMLDAVMAETLGLAMLNAVNTQQNAAIVRSAAVTMACTVLLSLPISDMDGTAASAAASAAPGDAEAPAASTPPAGTAPASETAAPDGSQAAAASAASATAPWAASPHVNPQVTDAIARINATVLDRQAVLTGGAGKAFQMVAQSAALAVQDATDAWRAVSTIAATAASVAMAKFLATGDSRYLLGVTAAQEMTRVAAEDFSRIGEAAAAILRGFPPAGAVPG